MVARFRTISRASRPRRLGWASLALGFAALFWLGSAKADEALDAAVDRIATEELRKDGAPGASVAVVQHGRVVLARAYGLARLSPELPARAEMAYPIGSISKQFTAAAILLLQEDGKLRLDDTIARFLPDLPHGDRVTIRQLLTHVSGYQDHWTRHDHPEAHMLAPETVDRIIALWGSKPLVQEPGAQFRYSSTGYAIAGRIVETVSGLGLEAFLERRIFRPLRMTGVHDLSAEPLPADGPEGYTIERWKGPLRPAPHEAPGWTFAAGQLDMSARDLALWNVSLIRHTLLKPASYRDLLSRPILADGSRSGYALGIGVGDRHGHLELEHVGGISGFLARSRVFPDDGAAVVVLANVDYGGIEDAICDRISDYVLGIPESRQDAKTPR